MSDSAGGGQSNRVSTGLLLDLSVARGPNALVGGAVDGAAHVQWRCCRVMQKTSQVGWKEKLFLAFVRLGPLGC